MSTDLITKTEEVVGTRRSLGLNKGSVLQLDLTQDELTNWLDVLVSWEHHNDWKPLRDVLAKCNHTLETPHSLNETARKLENHRWASEIPSLNKWASDLRLRAKISTKDSLKLV